MAGTLMILAGLLTFFIGITALIRGIFFNSVATFPFYPFWSVIVLALNILIIGELERDRASGRELAHLPRMPG